MTAAVDGGRRHTPHTGRTAQSPKHPGLPIVPVAATLSLPGRGSSVTATPWLTHHLSDVQESPQWNHCSQRWLPWPRRAWLTLTISPPGSGNRQLNSRSDLDPGNSAPSGRQLRSWSTRAAVEILRLQQQKVIFERFWS